MTYYFDYIKAKIWEVLERDHAVDISELEER